jgi:hypothetical protein
VRKTDYRYGAWELYRDMTNAEYKKLWVVEWSESQKNFHVDFLYLSVENHIEEYLRKVASGWTILAVVNTSDEATQLCEKLKADRAA